MRGERERVPLIAGAVAVAVLYFLVGLLGDSAPVSHAGISTLWPAAGVAVAAVVLLGARIWPGIVLGQVAEALVEAHGHQPLLALIYGGSAALEALLAGAILRRAHFNPRLHRIRDVLWLLLPAAIIPTLLSATLSVSATIIDESGKWSSFGVTLRNWWLGDATGIIVLAPLLLTVGARLPDWRPHLPQGLRLLEGGAFLTSLVAFIALAHLLPDVIAIAMPPVLIWSALRFGPAGSALATAVMAGVGAMIAPHLGGSWHLLAPQDQLLVTQDLFSIGALATLVLAAALAERQRLLEAHAALGRFATLVASEIHPDELVEAVSRGGGELLGVPVTVVERAEEPNDAVNAAVDVAGERWGWITLPGLTRADNRRRFLNLDTMLPRFAALLGVGIANARAREALIAMARTDPLTGLANVRVFHEQLADEMSRSRRYGRPVAVAMIDIDNFKVINDSVGHVGGDKVLATVAERIASVMRNDSLVARLGGDEIAVILPESSAHGALIALQRARLAVSGSPVRPAGTVTLSAGVCDSTFADTAEKMLELADDALYWSKLHGRDMAVAYSPDVVKPMSEDERKHRLTRTRAVVGLKALAAMIDKREAGDEHHSERVSLMVGKLARAAGWPADLVERIREAAAIHDVGKIALDEGLLGKSGPRTRVEEDLWRRHPELSAQVTADVLDEEQARWVRWHHERPDGTGYPDRLGVEELPEGAALLALADGWDRLLHGQPGSPARTQEEALSVVLAEEGTRFTPDAIAALAAVLEEEAEAEAAAAAERELAEDDDVVPTTREH